MTHQGWELRGNGRCEIGECVLLIVYGQLQPFLWQ
jgi:hypothetical protein